MKFYEPKGENQIQNNEIPNSPGIYFLWSKEELIYIGYSSNVRQRILAHISGSPMGVIMVDNEMIFKISVMITKDKIEAEMIEKQLINLIPTKFNKNPFYKSNEKKEDVEGALKSYEKLF